MTVYPLDTSVAPSPHTLRLSRDMAGPIRTDQTTESHLRLTGTTKHHTDLDVRDTWPPLLNPLLVRQRMRPRPGTSERVSTVLALTRRGVYEADIIAIRSWGPLYLDARQVSLPTPPALSVLPELKACVLLPSRLAYLHELEGVTPTTLRDAGTEFDSLRSYIVGDGPRDTD